MRRINVLIGPNGAGKSSVLQALLLWRQSMQQSHIRTNGPFLDLGDARDVQLTERHAAEIGLTVEKSIALPSLLDKGGETQVVASVDAPIASGESHILSTISAGPMKFTRDWIEGRAKVDPEQYSVGSSAVSLGVGGTVTIPIQQTGGDMRLMEDIGQVTAF